MDLHADDDLPVAAGALDQVRFRRRCGHRHYSTRYRGTARGGPPCIFVRRCAGAPQVCRSSTRVRPAQEPRSEAGGGPMSADARMFLMTDSRAPNGKLGALIGAVIAIALALFLLNGGEHVGKKTVNSDNDLPPVAQGQQR